MEVLKLILPSDVFRARKMYDEAQAKFARAIQVTSIGICHPLLYQKSALPIGSVLFIVQCNHSIGSCFETL